MSVISKKWKIFFAYTIMNLTCTIAEIPENLALVIDITGGKNMNFDNWKWLNESQIITSENEVAIYAPGHTDWFRNPIPEGDKLSDPVANAPFFYTEVTGDFVFRAKVQPNFRTVYDACALMVIENDVLWTKAAFEKSDFGTTAAVCVVTNEISDDANGCNIEQDHVWLQIVRVGDIFCTHYSLDGEHFILA